VGICKVLGQETRLGTHHPVKKTKKNEEDPRNPKAAGVKGGVAVSEGGFGGFKGQGGVAQANQNRMMGGTTARASFKQTVSNCQKKLNETKEEKKRA